MTIYRTLADPAYLDPTIDPDDRPLGSLFAFPDPFDANYGRGGLARDDDVTRAGCRRGRDCRRRRSSPTRCPRCHVPDARRARDRPTPRSAAGRPARSPTRRGSDDVTYEEIAGAPHYLEGHRPAAMRSSRTGSRARFP